MIPLGDDNARTGYQDIIDTYREAKQWPEATAAAKKRCKSCRTTTNCAWCWNAQLADTGDPEKAARRCAFHAQRQPEDRDITCGSPSCTRG